MDKKQSSDKTNWYKDAIIYQAHVRSFQDTKGDGIGDFNGLIQKLDYLEKLGVTAVWLLPFYQSPLKDGGYDISDFTAIHEDYGTMTDFKRFIREAHKRGLRVITELVLNHTSDEHKWFKRAREAKPGTSYRDFYVWSDTTDKYKEARIIFQDFENSNWTWDPVAQAYYWHRFYSHQPDLNFDNPAVHKAVVKVLDFWFDAGVDGLRLDAVPYLYEREGTNCENLPETHDFLKKLRKHIDQKYEDKMLLAEANQWPEDASAYFGDGDECHMSFHFPLMPRLYMSMRMEDRFPIVDILEQTPSIPDSCQWAIFLRNHDELTLEMVSDEERDYMYKAFTQNVKQRINLGIRRRLAPLLNNDRKNIELMNILLFSMPGTPIIYYGDEIGMGDNYYLGDRDGVRTPMQWSADRNAGFSTTEPQQMYLPVIYNHDYHYESINVENNEKNPSSLLWWMRRIIAQRKAYKAFSRGDIKFIPSNNSKILAFTRSYEDEVVLVLVNLSRYAQQAELDLSEYKGYTPVEVFSKNKFSKIKDKSYKFPLQFKNYFWFELLQPTKKEDKLPDTSRFHLEFTTKQWNAAEPELLATMQKMLLNYAQDSRWFRGKARRLKGIDINEVIPLTRTRQYSYMLLFTTRYVEGKDEQYIIPLSLAAGNEAMEIKYDNPKAVIGDVKVDDQEGILYDGSFNAQVRDAFLKLIVSRSKTRIDQAEISGMPGKNSAAKKLKEELPLPSKILGAEQSNTSVLYDNRLFFKLYRSPEEGNNPELDILKSLTEETTFRNFPTYVGSLEYRSKNSDPMALGILVDFIPNEGNAWDYVQGNIEGYFERIMSESERLMPHSSDNVNVMLDTLGEDRVKDLIGPFFLEMIGLLGKRTAEMHVALSSIKGKEDFREQPFSLLYQKSLYQSFRTLIRRTLSEMRSAKKRISKEQRKLLNDIFENEQMLLLTIKNTLEQKKIRTTKIRVHGDYHLGQVLFTGKDFIIIDFEGEPTRSLTARSLKYCPFKDVAGMLRSFHYAIYMGQIESAEKYPEHSDFLKFWLEAWYKLVKEKYIESYLEEAGKASFIPREQKQIDDLLSLFTIEKAIYEADYEFNNRPDWLHIPLNGLNQILMSMVEQEQESLV